MPFSPKSGSPVHSGASGWTLCSTRTIPSQHAKLEEVGILESLKLPKPFPRSPSRATITASPCRCSGTRTSANGSKQRATRSSHRREPDIEARIDAIVDDLSRAQSPDGYLNCWYNGREPDKRWTNLRDNHELYNAGHLLEGAIAYFRATGRAAAPRHHGALRRPYRRNLRDGARTKARLPRPSRNRTRADQALPPDWRPAAA